MNNQNHIPFAERHPLLNRLFGMMILVGLAIAAGFLIKLFFEFLGHTASSFINVLKSKASNLEAVVIVSLITGSVSLVSVIISSIVSKIIDYKKQRQSYLSQKREKSYFAFIEMVYKLQSSANNRKPYKNDEMIRDISSFSQELTLWGSKGVANKWIRFRKQGANPEEAAQKSIFLLEDIINEMRKDMGVKKLKNNGILAFFINDIDNIKRK